MVEEGQAEDLFIEMQRRTFPVGADDKGERYDYLCWSRNLVPLGPLLRSALTGSSSCPCF